MGVNPSEERLKGFWDGIPIGRDNAASYGELMAKWDVSQRAVRKMLNALSLYDDGGDYVLIRSSHSRGFYRTSDRSEIEAFRQECLNRGRSCLAPLHKINKVLKRDGAADLFDFALDCCEDMD